MNKRLLPLLPGLALLAVSFALPAQAKSPPPQKVASVEGLDEYVLPNGLHILLFPDPTKETTTVDITYLVGSRFENYGETGMAHLLEHLMFKGSAHHPNVTQEMTAHGAQYNGTTGADRTTYFETFQSSDANLQWALELEADRMVTSRIAKKDLDSEMTVVRNELEKGENSPQRILNERVAETAYLWHNYGHPTIGARSDVENVPIDRLQAFWRLYYQPDNAWLTVAGRFDEAATLGWIAKSFGAIPKPNRVIPPIYTIEPTQDGDREVVLKRTGDTQEVMVAYHVPAGSHPDSTALDALAFILGDDSPSGRLHKALVETGKAAAVFAWTTSNHDPGLIQMGAAVRKEKSLDDARATLLQVVEEDLASHPITAEEVERAKANWLKDFDLTMSDPGRVGVWIADWISQGDWRLMFLERDAMKKLQADEVTRVAKAYLKTSNRTLGLFVPVTPDKVDRAEIPLTPNEVAQAESYKGGEGITAGEAFDPTPENIQKRLTQNALPVGLKLITLPKKNRGGMVYARLSLRFGDATSLKGKVGASGAAGTGGAGSMLMRGTLKHTRQQIRDLIDQLGARIDVDGGGAEAYATIEVKREHFAEALKLVAEILREPAFPEKEAEEMKQEILAGIEARKTQPETVAGNAWARHWNTWPKDDIRYAMTPDEAMETVKATTVADMKAFWKGFYGAGNGELAVVGDVDPGEVKKLAGELFGDWKSPLPFHRLENPWKEIGPLTQSIETPDKANAVLRVGETFAMKDDDPDYPAMVLGNYLTGGAPLSSRLAVRIRQKEGLSYGVGSYFAANALDNYAVFGGLAIFAPQNVDRVTAAFKEELAKVVEKGFTSDEVAQARKGWLQEQQLSRAQDGSLAGTLSYYAYLDRPITWQSELEKKVSALDGEAIRAALARHLDVAKLTWITAGDFAKAKKNPPGKPGGSSQGSAD